MKGFASVGTTFQSQSTFIPMLLLPFELGKASTVIPSVQLKKQAPGREVTYLLRVTKLASKG